MPNPEPLGPFCQSCGTPLTKPEDFGTCLAGYRVNDYCHSCYQDGKFTQPDISLPEMIDHGVEVLVKTGEMPEVKARPLLSEVLPRLKRWRIPQPVSAEAGSHWMRGDEIC